MRLWLLVALYACANTPLHESTGVVGPTLQLADLFADLEALETAYKTLHPGMLRYNSEAEIDGLFTNAHHELEHARSLGDAFVIFTRLTAAIRCGHSYPNPSNQTKAVASELFAAPRVPFLFRWIGDEMVITNNFSGRSELAAGSVIESLDGVTTTAILTALLPLARADGHNDAKRRAYLSDVGESPHEAFDILAPLVFPQLSRPLLAVRVRSPASKLATTVEVPLQSVDERAAAVAALRLDPSPDQPLWHAQQIAYEGQAIEYLAMPTWVAYKTQWDWMADLEATVQQLVDAKIPALIVDLRGNEGGNDIGDVLLAHLIDRPLAHRAFKRRTRFGDVPETLRPILDTWDPTFFYPRTRRDHIA